MENEKEEEAGLYPSKHWILAPEIGWCPVFQAVSTCLMSREPSISSIALYGIQRQLELETLSWMCPRRVDSRHSAAADQGLRLFPKSISTTNTKRNASRSFIDFFFFFSYTRLYTICWHNEEECGTLAVAFTHFFRIALAMHCFYLFFFFFVCFALLCFLLR